jgi:hypothetical protein
MKKIMLTLMAAGAILFLAGCCCEKSGKCEMKKEHCIKKHCHSKPCKTPANCPEQKCPVSKQCPQQTPAAETATETVVVEAVGN